MDNNKVNVLKLQISIILILVISLISGCDSNSGNAPITDIDIHKGTDGIKMSIVKDMPPTKIYEQEEFTVSVNVENKGASDVSLGVLYLNIEEDYVLFDNFLESDYMVDSNGRRLAYDLKGKSEIHDEGESEIFSARLTGLDLDKQSQSHETFVSFTTCYEYKSYFADEFCIDANILNSNADTKKDKVCTVSDNSYSGQGGPVAVSKVEPTMYIDENRILKPSFTIYVKNVGRGIIVEKDSVLKTCSSSSQTRRIYSFTLYLSIYLEPKSLTNPSKLATV